MQLRPSVQSVFGMDKPDPFVHSVNSSCENAKNVVMDKTPQMWARDGGNVIERNSSSMDVAMDVVKMDVVQKKEAMEVVENLDAVSPKMAFPKPGEEVLIEGYAFASKHVKLAKKLEKLNSMDLDSEEELSSSDSEDEEVRADEIDLPYFINLWRKLSDYISINTKQFVFVHVLDGTIDVPTASRIVSHQERCKMFCKHLEGPLNNVSQVLDIHVSATLFQQLLQLVQTFAFREPINVRNRNEVHISINFIV